MNISTQTKAEVTWKPRANDPSYIPLSVFEKSRQFQAENNFIKYLSSLFGTPLTDRLINHYFVGSAKHWPGATVFWQIDMSLKVRTGKIILYDPDSGNRIKKPFNHVTWAHTLLKIKDFDLMQCFFGEHLLSYDNKKPVAIVESEKTAIIASVYMQELIWLACGGINELATEKFKTLSGRKILLFPDVNGFEKWTQRASEISKKIDCKISVSELLEANATKEERENGFDIADYLIKRDDKFGWALSADNYPLFWDK